MDDHRELRKLYFATFGFSIDLANPTPLTDEQLAVLFDALMEHRMTSINRPGTNPDRITQCELLMEMIRAAVVAKEN